MINRFVPPPVLARIALIDVLCRALDGVDALKWRGWLELDDGDEIPPEMIVEMACLAVECKHCRIGPHGLSGHWLNFKEQQWQEEWERSLPAWTCDCGAVYKVELSKWETPHKFWKPAGDRLQGPLCAGMAGPGGGDCPHDSCPDIFFGAGSCLLGDPVGAIKTSSTGKVRQSDRCPACGEKYADVIARQNDPQQALW